MDADEKYMRLALRAARRGVGRTSPNPPVGAVLVRGGRVLARGWHRAAGGPHAEIEALRAAAKAGARVRGATMYVTLEPCSTVGRTPACTGALIAAGVARVVYGARDPNPKHAGRADRILRAAGIEVRPGVLGEECAELIRPFARWVTTGRPWVIAKLGMTLDGRLTLPPGEGRWITSEESRADVMRWRARCDAIIVGAGTVRADNPRLTVRGLRGARQPWRVVMAGRGDLPRDAALFTDEWKERTLVYRDKSAGAVLDDLGRRGVTSVLVEGGGAVMGSFFDRDLVDEVVFYYAPVLAGGGVAAVGGRGAGEPVAALRLREVRHRRFGSGDLRLTGLVVHRDRPATKPTMKTPSPDRKRKR